MTESLFLTQPAFEKVAHFELSPDPVNWPSEITRYIYEKKPFLSQYTTRIRLDKADDKQGYGYGAVIVEDKISIPVIIRNFELLPMDVYSEGEEFFPLSERRIDEILMDTSLFSRMVPPEVDSGGFSENYPPHSGKYVYAEAKNKGKILDKIAFSVTETDKNYFLNKLEDDDTRLMYQVNNHLGVVRKIASIDTARGVDPTFGLLVPNVVQVEKVSHDKFLVRAVSDALYAPVERTMTGQEVIEKLGQDTYNHAMETNEHTTVMGREQQRSVPLDDLQSELTKLNRYSRVEVRDSCNHRLRGWLFPRVIDFDGAVVGTEKLFTDGHDCWGMQPDIVGVEIDSDVEMLEDPPSCCLDQGVTGVFYYRDEKGRAACTVPVTVCSPVFDMGDYIRVEVNTALGQAMFLEISPNAASIMPSRRDKYTRIVPAAMTFVRVGKCVRLQDDTNTVLKFATAALEDRNAIYISTNDGMKFHLAGTQAGDLAGGPHGISKNKAKFHLVAMGLTPQQACSALCKATENGRYSIANLKPLMTMHEKEAQVRTEIVEPFMAKLPRIKMDLIKEAAFFDDPDTVDAVLSLNFINPENINMFIEMLPDLRQTASDVAELLVSARLGMNAVPEEAAKKTLDNLELVIEGLENLHAVAEQP